MSFKFFIFINVFLATSLWAQNSKKDYDALAKELEVRELSTLMFAKYND